MRGQQARQQNTLLNKKVLCGSDHHHFAGPDDMTSEAVSGATVTLWSMDVLTLTRIDFKALGLAVPATLLASADKVIE